MSKILCPSIMCADFSNLNQTIKELDEAGVDIFHCDIMDGSFVPNISMGLNDVKAVRMCTDKPIDCHLMIKHPASKIQWFIDAGANIIYIHPESERYCIKTLDKINAQGCKAGIAINPETTIDSIKKLLPHCAYVMVMSVTPGFAGQKFIDSVIPKIDELVELKSVYGYKLMLDGACSPERIEALSKRGVDGFILGTSALFGKNKSFKELIADLR